MRGGEDYSDVIFYSDGAIKFPLYWTSEPASISGFDFDRLSEYEKDVVLFLEKMMVCNIKYLMDHEGDVMGLDAYLRECFVLLVLR